MVGAVVAGGGWFTPSAEGANRPWDWAESVKLANFGPEEMGCGLVFGPVRRTDGDECDFFLSQDPAAQSVCGICDTTKNT